MGSFPPPRPPAGGSKPTLRGHEAPLHDLLSGKWKLQGMRLYTYFHQRGHE